MRPKSRPLLVVATLAFAVSCSPGDGDAGSEPITPSTIDGGRSTSLPDRGDVPLTVRGEVLEVIDQDAFLLGGARAEEEVVVIVRRRTTISIGERVEATGTARVLDVDALERQLLRSFSDRLRSFDGMRVVVAEAMTVADEPTEGDT